VADRRHHRRRGYRHVPGIAAVCARPAIRPDRATDTAPQPSRPRSPDGSARLAAG
jgi:hypothetical protein